LQYGAQVGAAGTVLSGGLILGLLNNQGDWAVHTSIPPGSFAVSVRAPAAGVYRVVLANNLPNGEAFNSAWVLAVAFIGEPGKRAKSGSKGLARAFRAIRHRLHWGRNSSLVRLGQRRK
jgi:hypothetical protein